jgi:cyclic dehypoxanthinyl futalosine synthase
MALLQLIDRILAGKRLSPAEALELWEGLPLPELGQLAELRKKAVTPHPHVVTYIIDRNINYTNICTADCVFCAFYRRPGSLEGYVLPEAEIFAKIDALWQAGGRQILLQGGHNPELGIAYYENLFRSIKTRYDIKLHALSPSEILHICEISNLSIDETLRRLRAAGLDSIPGGGAEILVDRVRKRLMRHKASSDDWLLVMERAHALGFRTTATMMFGHIEKVSDRIEHLIRLQDLQEKTHGFTAFIPWTFQKEHTGLAKGDFFVSPNEYLRLLALSRIILKDFVNIQVSFVTMGEAAATLGLRFGANDYGSVMMEENVVRAAGAENPLGEPDIRHAIRSAGFTPRRRNMQYDLLPEPPDHRLFSQATGVAA